MFSKTVVRSVVPALMMMIGGVLAVPGCGGGDDSTTAGDVQALCRDVADTMCEKLYECLPASTLANEGLPSTVAGCKTLLREDQGCDAADANDTCRGSEVYSAANARKCANQMRTASCNQFLSASGSEEYAPACDKICIVE